jgi:hypothetical protein
MGHYGSQPYRTRLIACNQGKVGYSELFIPQSARERTQAHQPERQIAIAVSTVTGSKSEPSTPLSHWRFSLRQWQICTRKKYF